MDVNLFHFHIKIKTYLFDIMVIIYFTTAIFQCINNKLLIAQGAIKDCALT